MALTPGQPASAEIANASVFYLILFEKHKQNTATLFSVLLSARLHGELVQVCFHADLVIYSTNELLTVSFDEGETLFEHLLNRMFEWRCHAFKLMLFVFG